MKERQRRESFRGGREERRGIGRRAVKMRLVTEQRWGEGEREIVTKRQTEMEKGKDGRGVPQMGSTANRGGGRDGKRTSITGLGTETGEGQRSE